MMGFSPFGGVGDMMFSIVPVIVCIGFIVVFGIVIGSAIRGAGRWKRNNDSPVLTVEAMVVTKRADVRYHHHNTGTDHMHHGTASTTYYATFEVASGDRMELEIRDSEYGLLVEKDNGKLTFQGTRYLGFERGKN